MILQEEEAWVMAVEDHEAIEVKGEGLGPRKRWSSRAHGTGWT